MRMKLCLLIVFFCLANIILFAQDNLTLSLELVKPTGKIDTSSYFEAKLQNHNDTLGMIIDHAGDGFCNFQRHSFLRVIYGKVGHEQMGNRQPFFWYGDKKIIRIEPNSTWIVRLPLFFPLVGCGNGILSPLEKAVPSFPRVQIKVEELTFWLMRSKNHPVPPKRTIDLYSNWVDIPCEEVIKYLHR